MATTAQGIIYPTSTDNIAPLETHFANLAESVDLAITAAVEGGTGATSTFQSGTVSLTGPSGSGNFVTQSVTFPTTYLSVPTITLTVEGNAPYAASIYGAPTTTGFVAKIYKLKTSGSETVKLHWMAK